MACCDGCAKSGGNCGAKKDGVPFKGDGTGGMLAKSNGSGSMKSNGSGSMIPKAYTGRYSLGKDPGTTTTTTVSSGASWMTVALSVAAGAVLGVGALALYQRYYENPAHDDLVGRRAQYRRFRGTVVRSEGNKGRPPLSERAARSSP
jgi:hypothetical protein